jgi:hypothetical protein
MARTGGMTWLFTVAGKLLFTSKKIWCRSSNEKLEGWISLALDSISYPLLVMEEEEEEDEEETA